MEKTFGEDGYVYDIDFSDGFTGTHLQTQQVVYIKYIPSNTTCGFTCH